MSSTFGDRIEVLVDGCQSLAVVVSLGPRRNVCGVCSVRTIAGYPVATI